jgi:hypothetical protein
MCRLASLSDESHARAVADWVAKAGNRAEIDILLESSIGDVFPRSRRASG